MMLVSKQRTVLFATKVVSPVNRCYIERKNSVPES